MSTDPRNPLGAAYAADRDEKRAHRISRAFSHHLGAGEWTKCHELIADADIDRRDDMRKALADRYARRRAWEKDDGECDVLLDAFADAEPIGRLEAQRLAVEAVLEGNTLINGRDPAEDGVVTDEVEEETREIPAESMSELVHGRRGAAA